MRRALFISTVLAALVVLPVTSAGAHPLGNFTVNRYSGIVVQPTRVLVRYIVDMAEIPAFQAQRQMDTNGDGVGSDPERAAYTRETCRGIATGAHLIVDGQARALVAGATTLSFPPGAAGLVTLRLTCALETVLPGEARTHTFAYIDTNFPGRIGWSEITAAGDGATLQTSDVPGSSLSAELTRYPQDLLSSPLDVRVAHIHARPGGARLAQIEAPAPALLPRGVDAFTRAFTSFIGRRRLTVGFGLVATLLAIVLGAVHALSPGHGKTVMAAYLVGETPARGRMALIAITVTATHTAGVAALGIALSASAAVAPNRLYPILGAVSGLMLASIGVSLIARARRTHTSEHGHGHEHAPPAPLRARSFVAMGFAGGLAPSPSALVVLLGAIALHRTWFGLALVVAYGVGMALTLTGAGTVLLRARRRLERREGAHRGVTAWVQRAAPSLSAMVVTVVGLTLAIRGIAQI